MADPRCSAPEVVAEVQKKLGVGEDAARLFLQILSLPNPSDANVRAWNGWRKKNIDAAAAELVESGLVVEATRKGAGRSRFLPGGWLEGHGGANASKPMEVWKAPMYLVWQDTKASPIISGCPPHVPVPELFHTVWKRYSSGDTPGYEEFNTTRYRSR